MRMKLETIAELELEPGSAADVYAEGWQSWSPLRMHRTGEAPEPPADERSQITSLRPGKPTPVGAIQAEGVLAIALPGGPARAWFAPQPAAEVPTLRLTSGRDRVKLTADGRVDELQAADLSSALAAVGDRIGVGEVMRGPAGWCSWSYYFKGVTEDDVVENVEAARRMSLPIEVAQLDDGYETAVGDWLDVDPRFGSVQRLGAKIASAGMRPGIWTAPFMVSPTSSLARLHPDWLVGEADAGHHWGEPMRILDVTNPAAAEHLVDVFRTLAGWGFAFHKIDFLYAGAIDGHRHQDSSGIDAYREGLRLIRSAVGADATLLACGAPLLPSIGLCDAMRIGPDVLQETIDPQPEVEVLKRISGLRAWMNGRLWVNDPDHLVVRPGIAEREAWAGHLEQYQGVVFSGDRLTELDGRGIELTRRVLGGNPRAL